MEQNLENLGIEKPIEIMPGVQVKFLSFKQKLGGKIFPSKKQQKAAAVCEMPFQSINVPKVDNGGLSNEIRTWKQKIFPRSQFFPTISAGLLE